MFSCNVPIDGAVGERAGEIAHQLPEARARVRGERTLVCKRLGRDVAPHEYHELEARAREAIRGTPAFQARVTGVDCFEAPERGAGPVVYLAVESPELQRLHCRLCDVVDPVAGLEGEAYVPHVTVARGGSLERAREVCAEAFDPITWTVTDLVFWDAERDRAVSRVSLPA